MRTHTARLVAIVVTATAALYTAYLADIQPCPCTVCADSTPAEECAAGCGTSAPGPGEQQWPGEEDMCPGCWAAQED